MKYTKKFIELSRKDSHIAGGKGASLGEMLNNKIPVPDGYVVTADTFDNFLSKTDLTQEIKAILETVNTKAIHTVEDASEKIQGIIKSAKMPEDIEFEILSRFKELNAEYVAVRSSATAEDGVDHAWAGQLNSYLNTREESLLEMVQNCWASLFTPRAIFYRFEKGLNTTNISVAVVVQKMVNSEKSGIAFSVHPVTEDYNQIIIEAGFGLGEAIVSGAITPDSYVVTKEPKEIIDVNVNTQNKALYRGTEKTEHGFNEWKDLSESQANEQVLNKDQILELSTIIETIENNYSFPCDIEWAFEDGKFYIVQSRPITTLKPKQKQEEFFDKQISLTEWFSNMNHQDSLKHREEDNEKRERLALLNEIIGLPFDRPSKFSLVDILNRSEEFTKYFNENGDKKCALRLIPLDKELKKLRMRGKTVREVTEDWLPQQDIDPKKYRADYVPHADESFWSSIFVINKNGIRGEIIADSHEKLTQGFYNENKPILFEYNFKTWKLFPENNEAERHLEKVISNLLVPKDKQSKLTEVLGASFSFDYLNGYFETVDTDQGLWFIDYNRLINHEIPDINIENKSGSGLIGRSASPGKYTGTICIVNNPSNIDFKEGDILVCDMTSPEYLPLMQKAGAILTNRGGVTCHAAIIAREIKIPCIVGTEFATKVLKNGDVVEVDADNGTVRILNDDAGDQYEYDPKDYIRMFAGKAFSYILTNLFLTHYGTLGVLSMQDEESWMSFLPKSTHIKTLEEGQKLYTSEELFNNFHREFNGYMNSTSSFCESVLKKEEVTTNDVKEFFNRACKHWVFYSKTEFFYTDNIDLKKMVINIEEFDKLKLEGRAYLNKLIFEDTGYVKGLLDKVSSQTSVSRSELLNYKVEEIINLLDKQEKVPADTLEKREVFFASQDTILFGDDSRKIVGEFLKPYRELSNIIKGTVARKGKVIAKARVLMPEFKDFDKILKAVELMEQGEVLVAETTSPDIISACKKASAIITNQGGTLSHAAIISRELGIPCIIGTDKDVILNIKTGDLLEVDADNGVIRILDKN